MASVPHSKSPSSPSSSQSQNLCTAANQDQAFRREGEVWSRAQTVGSEGEEFAFRQRFLQALQYYCDTPSLILNSDLPADLVEYVTRQNFPVQSLAVILELKRGGKIAPSSSGGQQNPVQSAELTRKLVETWISSDSCAEALVSLSLGDEVPGVLAETSNFYRLLFVLPECFHIPSEDYQTFLLEQCGLGITSIAYGVREHGFQGKIRSEVLAALLNKIFLRYHADSEQFYTQTWASSGSSLSKAFPRFVEHLATTCRKDFVARRFVSKILQGFSNHSGFKFAKTVFIVGNRSTCSATSLFYPPEDFHLKKDSSWSRILCTSIPTKTPTKSKRFWSNWASFIVTAFPSLTDVWEDAISNWESLCRSPAVHLNTLVPSTYALIALAREIKNRPGEGTAQVLASTSRVLDSVAKCLDSTSEEKKACGMGLAQVIGNLHALKVAGKDSSSSTDESGTRLKFSSSIPVFHELITFYEEELSDNQDEVASSSAGPSSSRDNKKYQVLDSDDDMEEDESQDHLDSEREDGRPYAAGMESVPTDERILDYRSRKGQLPMYFSDFVELLVEGGGPGSNEGEIEALKYLCIMKIPLLINLTVRIDEKMAETLVKCLVEFEGGSNIEIPIIFALYEICSIHPIVVFESLANAAFDKDHFTSGHRMAVLQRYGEITQLFSKSKCVACFSKNLKKAHEELISICPEFFFMYMESKNKCSACPTSTEANHSSAEAEPEVEGASTQQQQSANLTWQEIVARRVKAKTRYFVTPKRKTPIIVPDDYSSKLVPLIWASIANRLISKAGFFMDEQERKVRGGPHDMILAQIFRLLGRVLLELRGPACPHLGSIGIQVGELTRIFVSHSDAPVRHAVFALLAIIITISEGAGYIIEAISGGSNIFDSLKTLRHNETNIENQNLLDSLTAYVAQAATLNYAIQFPSLGNTDDNAYSKFRFLPGNL